MIAYLESEEDLSNLRPDDKDTRELVQALGSFDLPAYVLNRKTKCHKLWAKHSLGLPGIEEDTGIPCSLVDLLAQLDVASTTDALFDWQLPPGEPAQVYAWDATRYAAIVRALEDSKSSKDLDIASALLSRGVTLRELARLILEKVHQSITHLPPDFGHFKQTLVFPLVMAASQKKHLDDTSKEFIVSTLQTLSMECSYNLRRGILNLVQDHWRNDADTIEDTARRLDIEVALW